MAGVWARRACWADLRGAGGQATRWTPGQLEAQIAGGAWLAAAVDRETVLKIREREGSRLRPKPLWVEALELAAQSAPGAPGRGKVAPAAAAAFARALEWVDDALADLDTPGAP